MIWRALFVSRVWIALNTNTNMAPYSSRMAFPTTVLAVNTVGIALSFLVVVLRTYARLSRNIKFRLCDYTIIASWVGDFSWLSIDLDTLLTWALVRRYLVSPRS